VNRVLLITENPLDGYALVSKAQNEDHFVSRNTLVWSSRTTHTRSFFFKSTFFGYRRRRRRCFRHAADPVGNVVISAIFIIGVVRARACEGEGDTGAVTMEPFGSGCSRRRGLRVSATTGWPSVKQWQHGRRVDGWMEAVRRG